MQLGIVSTLRKALGIEKAITTTKRRAIGRNLLEGESKMSVGSVLSRMRLVAQYTAPPDFAEFEEVTHCDALYDILADLECEHLRSDNADVRMQLEDDINNCDTCIDHYARGARAFVARDDDGYYFAYAHE